MTDCEVLIVGAGPTGLVLALWLAKLGVRLAIVDRTQGPGTTSRALAVQARTLELYRQLDLTRTVIEEGHRVPAVNMWVKGARKARIAFAEVGHRLTPYPFMHIFPQDRHETLLIERLAQFGIAVRRKTELLSYREEGEHVLSRLKTPEGEEECRARFIAGCDGARSRVRDLMGTGFPGGTYSQVFYVADVDAWGPALDGELHVDLDQADFLALFPLKGRGRGRLIGTVSGERARDAESLTFDDVAKRAIGHMKVGIAKVNWFSTYRLHHRVARQFRKGRAFLAGDAAHVHSPVAGQGMNTGIGDAINLAWKLASAVQGKATGSLLDTYEPERIAFARRLVQTTDKVFSFATAEGLTADMMRMRIAPIVLPALAKVESVREWLFRTGSQTLIRYRDSSLSQGRAGRVHGGDRLPWVSVGGIDNFDSLGNICWQGHVYGQAQPALRQWFERRGVPLTRFAWRNEYRENGLKKDALYLLRPDSYVALAAENPSPEMLTGYFARRGLSL